MNKRMISLAATLLTAGIGGCGIVQPSPRLPADAFVANQQAVGSSVGQGVDHSGPLIYDAQHRPPVKEKVGGGETISETVREAVKPPGPEAADTQPAVVGAGQFVAPTTQGSGVTTGQFQMVGAVLAVVNEEPIYADKVLNTLDRALSAEARANSEERFRAVAEDLIGKQIREFIDNDLEYAAAKNSLEKKDEQIAKFVTAEWRKEQVRKAGGSEALARQRATEDGLDFEELVRQQFRLNMTRLYYQNKIFPLIQVGANDMRQFYDANLRQFQKTAAAKFRVIWISSEASGTREAALKKAQDVAERAKAHEDFGALSTKFNDDPGLKKTLGVVGSNKGWMEKGEYAIEKVEQAAWDLKPGEVSTPIDVSNRGRDGFWVVKLEEIRQGVTEPFGSQKVQDEIRETLRRTQFAALREQHRRKLVQEAVIRENADMRNVVMEMVMQRYRVWVATR